MLNYQFSKQIALVIGFCWLVGQVADLATACPFCTAASQTLRQEMTSMDVVAFAKLIPTASETIDGQASFVVTKVIQGEKLAEAGNTLVAPYFGVGKTDKTFLVMAVGGEELLWSSPLTLTDTSQTYIEKQFKLSDDPSERLRFYIDYLENPEPLLAGDAYDEFALAPYEDVKKMSDVIDRDKIWRWIDDKNVSPDRKRLYYTLLGVLAVKADGERLEKKLRSSDPDERAGLDALIACYLTIQGEAALPTIDELFLTNAKCPYSDTYAAMMALRFQGTEGKVIERAALLKSMRHLLDRPDYADLVIPDLARWEDWSQVDKLVKLFEDAQDSDNWIRVPVINYMRMCPLPEAKVQLKHLEEVDPKAFQRAKTFFPIIGDNSMLTPSEQKSLLPSGPIATDTSSLIAFQHERMQKLDAKENIAAVDVFTSSGDSKLNTIAASLVTLLTMASLASVMAIILKGRSGEFGLVNRVRHVLLRNLS